MMIIIYNNNNNVDDDDDIGVFVDVDFVSAAAQWGVSKKSKAIHLKLGRVIEEELGFLKNNNRYSQNSEKKWILGENSELFN